MQGREIAILADGPYGAGWHNVTWGGVTKRGTTAPGGVYFVRYVADVRSRIGSPW